MRQTGFWDVIQGNAPVTAFHAIEGKEIVTLVCPSCQRTMGRVIDAAIGVYVHALIPRPAARRDWYDDKTGRLPEWGFAVFRHLRDEPAERHEQFVLACARDGHLHVRFTGADVWDGVAKYRRQGRKVRVAGSARR